MKGRELYMRCVKARIMSWLNSAIIGAVLPTQDGHGIVLAVYQNGRYVEPETIMMPNSPADMWGPDGPVGHYGQPLSPDNKPPEDGGGEEEPPDGTDK
jgi:hypothetical protein